jgi:hypothetical protein
MTLLQSRRRFVGTTTLAGAGALIGDVWPALADDGPPEPTTVRILKEPGIYIQSPGTSGGRATTRRSTRPS